MGAVAAWLQRCLERRFNGWGSWFRDQGSGLGLRFRNQEPGVRSRNQGSGQGIRGQVKVERFRNQGLGQGLSRVRSRLIRGQVKSYQGSCQGLSGSGGGGGPGDPPASSGPGPICLPRIAGFECWGLGFRDPNERDSETMRQGGRDVIRS